MTDTARDGANKHLAFIVTVPLSLTFLRGQVRRLREAGFRISLICSPGPQTAEMEAEGAEVIAVPMERELAPLKDLRALWRLWRVLRKIRPDIVNVGTPKAGLLGGMAARLARVPHRVYTLHGLRLETTSGPKRWLLWLTERIACANVQHVRCVSNSLHEAAIRLRLGKPKKIYVLGKGSANGIDCDYFARTPERMEQAKELRAKLGIPAEAPVIGFAGRLTRDKGINELYRAFAKLKEIFPELRLLLLGDFESGDPVEPDVRKGLENDSRVVMPGTVADVAPYYRVMDVFALPSYREGLPTVSLEAQAAGLPVVTTRVTGAAESVLDGWTGVLVPAGDSGALAAALQELVENSRYRSNMAEAASSWIGGAFGQERVWQEIIADYVRMRSQRLNSGSFLRLFILLFLVLVAPWNSASAQQSDNRPTAYSTPNSWVDPTAAFYGAKCDWNGRTGTDDSAALQNAINAAIKRGTWLYIPAGRQCSHSATLDMTNGGITSVKIIGVGYHSELVYTGTGTGWRWKAGDGTRSIFGTVLENISFLCGNLSGCARAIEAWDLQNGAFRNVLINADGVHFAHVNLFCNGCAIVDFADLVMEGQAAGNPATIGIDCINCASLWFHHGNFFYFTVSTFRFSGTGTSHIVIDSNWFECQDIGVLIDDSIRPTRIDGLYVTHNRFVANGAAAEAPASGQFANQLLLKVNNSGIKSLRASGIEVTENTYLCAGNPTLCKTDYPVVISYSATTEPRTSVAIDFTRNEIAGNNKGFVNVLNGPAPGQTILTFDGNTTRGTRVLASGIQTSKQPVQSSAAPVILSGFGTGPSLNPGDGTAAFTLTIGAGGVAGTGIVGLPAAPKGWNCYSIDITTTSASVFQTKETATTPTSVTLTNFSNSGSPAPWTPGDVLSVSCFGR